MPPNAQPGFAEALEALKRPLDFVARDGFANLDVVRDLGTSLRTAASRLLPLLPKEKQPGLAAFARDVARWDVLPRTERERMVAQGLRLCASAQLVAPPAPKAAPPPRPSITEGSE